MSKNVNMSVVLSAFSEFWQPANWTYKSVSVCPLLNPITATKAASFSRSQNIPASVLSTAVTTPAYPPKYLVLYSTFIFFYWTLYCICLMYNRKWREPLWKIMKTLTLPRPLATWLTTGVWKAFHFLPPQHGAARIIQIVHTEGKVEGHQQVLKTEQRSCGCEGRPSDKQKKGGRDDMFSQLQSW